MFFWSHFPFVRMSIILMIGILVAYKIESALDYRFPFLFVLCFYALGQLFFNDHKIRIRQQLLSFTCLLCFFLCGMALYQSHKQRNMPDPQLGQGQYEGYLGILKSDGEELKNHFRFRVEITNLYQGRQSSESFGQVFLYLRKEGIKAPLLYGDLVFVKGVPSKVNAPLNPGEFNYKEFLNHENIYYQHFTKAENFRVVKKQAVKDLGYYLTSLRRNCIRIIKEKIEGENEQAIALALVLGDKSALDPEIKQVYAASGAMHVLAVSGLHVGMIYYLIILIFGKIRSVKNGKYIFALVAIVLLWIYAGITGSPPSVLRAVTMFSVIILSQTFTRQTNIYNSLAFAALILLVFNPSFLFSVGFQLSFLAVTGIIYFFPKIYHLYNPENFYLDKVWAFTCLALAAQFATFPISIYYFHQFPVYFWLSNLIVIPAAFLFVGGGIAILSLAFISFLSDTLGMILEKLIWVVNQLLFTLERIPHHLVTDLYITSLQTFLLYGFILCFILFFHVRKIQYLHLSILLIGYFSFISVSNHIDNQYQKKIVFYSVPNHTAIDFIEGGSSSLWVDKQLTQFPDKLKFHVAPYQLSLGLTSSDDKVLNPKAPFTSNSSFSLLIWNGIKILILNHPFKVEDTGKSLSVDYLVLSKNYKQDLEEISESIKFTKVIFDHSNNGYTTSYLEVEAERLHLPFHTISKKGALIVEL